MYCSQNQLCHLGSSAGLGGLSLMTGIDRVALVKVTGVIKFYSTCFSSSCRLSQAYSHDGRCVRGSKQHFLSAQSSAT